MKTTTRKGIIVIIQPWGGRHANLLYRLWPQRTYQLTGGSNTRLREIVLSVLGRKVRAHLAIRTNVHTFVTATSTAPRYTFSRAHQKLIDSTTTGTIRASRLATIRLTTRLLSQPPNICQSLPLECPPRTSQMITIGLCFRMPAQQAYKPPTPSNLIPPILQRRHSRSGRLYAKLAPKKCAAPQDKARDRYLRICNSPRRAQLPLLCPMDFQHGCRALPCRCAGAQPATCTRAAPWREVLEASSCTQHTDPVDTSESSFFFPLGMLSGV